MTSQASALPLAIDVTRLVRGAFLGRRPTGIDRVTLAYVRHLGPHARALLGRSRWVWEIGDGLSRAVLARLGRAAARTGACDLQGPAGLPPLRRRFVLHTAHSGLESAAYLAALRARGLLPVFLVHDLIPISHPAFSRPGIAQRHLQRMQHAVQAAAGLVCNSEATRQSLAELCATQGWRLPPTAVAHLGVEDWVRPQAGGPNDLGKAGAVGTNRSLASAQASSADGRRPYFVCVSTLEPRKNHRLLLEVWRALAARMGERTPELVLVGQRGWMYDELVHALQHDDVARRHVREVGDCSDEQLRTWLLGAQALLMPSLVEGFGLPVAEALGCGVPVVASRLPVYREFAGEVPDYLDARDTAGWAACLQAYCEPGSAVRSNQLARLQGWKPPTWAAHFATVGALLQEVAAREGAS